MLKVVWFCDPPLSRFPVPLVLRPVLCAMFPEPLPVNVPSPALEDYRRRMRAHMGLPNQLDTSRCVACRRPQTRSEAGKIEHHKTGACEACWDVLASNRPEVRAGAPQRCTRLNGPAACEYFLTWIEINRVRVGGNLTAHPELARHVIGIAAGVTQPPNLWLPNERP